MDNSDTKKEDVSRTYQGVDGYTPIAAYLGNEGWSIGLELRAGSQHTALRLTTSLARVFPRIERSSSRLTRRYCCARTVASMGASVVPRPKRKHVGQRWGEALISSPNGTRASRNGMPGWHAPTRPAPSWKFAPGKRVGLLSLNVERAWRKQKRHFRLVVQVTERTIDKKGQRLLVPEIELQGWWTNLDVPGARCH